MTRSILRHLESWFPSLAKNYRLTLLFIPLLTAGIGAIVIGVLSKDIDYSSSRLASGIFSGDDGIAQAMIYEYGLLVISVPFGAMLLSDVLTIGTSVSFVQYDLYCKTLIWLFMALPGVVLYSMLSEDYDADHSTEHHTSFAGGAAAKATAVVLFITYINNLVSVFFLNANMIRCVSEEDDFLRPVICVLLSLCNAVCSLMNLAMDLLTPMGTEQSSHFPVLGTAAAVLSYSVYILAALGFASIAAHAYDVLAKRSGTTLHNIEIIFAVTTSIGMFVAARVLSSSSSSVYQTADMTVSVWSRYQVSYPSTLHRKTHPKPILIPHPNFNPTLPGPKDGLHYRSPPLRQCAAQLADEEARAREEYCRAANSCEQGSLGCADHGEGTAL